jgi:hypothetical protein
MIFRRLIFFIVSALWFNSTSAAVTEKFRNLVYDQPGFTIENFVLGRTCFSLPGSSDNMPCNPADLADQKDYSLRFNLLADNQFSDLIKYSRELKSGDESGIINRALDYANPISHQMATSMWYRQDWWAVYFIPKQVGVVSTTTNPAYPQVAIHALQNQELTFRGGFFFVEDPRLKVGSQLRFVHREELRDSFALLDNNIVYFEPAFRYDFISDWRAAISVAVTNLVLYKKEKVSDAPAFEFGYSTSPDFLEHRLISSLHYTRRNDVSSYKDRLLWGAQYALNENFFGMISLGGQYYSFGLSARYDSVLAGIGYKNEEIPTPFYNTFTARTLTFDFGLRF